MKKIAVLLCSLIATLALFVSCASGNASGEGKKKGKSSIKTNPDYLNALDSGDYDSCIAYLENKNAKNEKKQKDYIRDYFDIAMMQHLSKDYESSISNLNEVNQLMHDAFTVSITKATGAALLNDNIADYAGHPYEYVYINVFNALNYYNHGDVDEAAVEIRMLNEKQREFFSKYGEILENYDPDKDIDDTTEENAEAKEGEEKTPVFSMDQALKSLNLNMSDYAAAKPEKSTKEDIFRDSALARYLSMIFYMMEKDPDSAKLDAATLKALGSSYNPADDIAIPSGKGRLNILAFTGLIGRRGEMRRIFGPIEGVHLDTGSGSVDIPPFDLEYAYPVFPAPQSYLYPVMEIAKVGDLPALSIEPGKVEITPMPANQIASVKVVMEDGTELKTELVEDLNVAVAHDVNTRARKAYNRSMARSITKKFSLLMTSSAALYTAQSNGLPIGIPYVALAKLVDTVDATETADIRQVYALPSTAQATAINLEPGTYSFKVQFLDEAGSVVEEKEFTDVAVTEDVPTLVEAICQK